MSIKRKLTNQQLEEIAERADKATEGPWGIADISDGAWIVDEYGDIITGITERLPDATFIANSRQDIPDLLKHISKQRTEIERLRKREQEATELLRFDTALMDKYVTEISKLRGLLENVVENGQCSTIDNIIKEL